MKVAGSKRIGELGSPFGDERSREEAAKAIV
jgi:hypothetical protein